MENTGFPRRMPPDLATVVAGFVVGSVECAASHLVKGKGLVSSSKALCKGRKVAVTMSLFSIFQSSSVDLRHKDDLWNYVIATTSTFGLLELKAVSPLCRANVAVFTIAGIASIPIVWGANELAEKSFDSMQSCNDLFEEYKGSKSSVSNCSTQSGGSSLENVESSSQSMGIIRSRYKKLKATKDDGDVKSEVDKYLDEDAEDDVDEFDILKWWSNNRSRFPTLSLIARDILDIPLTTVASESAFSTRGRVLDPFRSSLTPKIVEALICAEDWLRASSREVEEKFDDVVQLEKDLSKISLAPSIIDMA